jgi:hypothetical protein
MRCLLCIISLRSYDIVNHNVREFQLKEKDISTFEKRNWMSNKTNAFIKLIKTKKNSSKH